MSKAIVLFTNDLRVTANPMIDYLEKYKLEMIPVFIDYNSINPVLEFFPINDQKQEFARQSLHDLTNNLMTTGKKLLIIKENVIQRLCDIILEEDCYRIVTNNHGLSNLDDLLLALEKKFIRRVLDITKFDSNYLIDVNDLNFPLSKVPADFKQFLKLIKGVRLNDLVITPSISSSLGDLVGQIECHRSPELKPYKTNLNNHFSKFLPYLTIGQISPGQLLKIYESSDSKTTKLFTKQLLKLDFIRAHYRNYRDIESLQEVDLSYDQVRRIEQWMEGNTDNEFINAIMRKIRTLGNASLVSKKCAILYYIHVLKLPVFFGYQYFQSQLIEFENSLNHYLWIQYATININLGQAELEIEEQEKKLDPNEYFKNYWNNHKYLAQG